MGVMSRALVFRRRVPGVVHRAFGFRIPVTDFIQCVLGFGLVAIGGGRGREVRRIKRIRRITIGISRIILLSHSKRRQPVDV